MSLRPRPMRDAFLNELLGAMGRDERIFFLTADFGSPVLDRLRAEYPDRFVNVGIAEQNLVNLATGLALEGFKVFAYAIAPFITMRCYEQIRVNLALLGTLREVDVTLVGVGAGYSYVISGPTHQCYEDLTIMRVLPNMQLLSPADWVAARATVNHCLRAKGPKYVRLDAQPSPALYAESHAFDFARGFSEIHEGDGLCVVSTGYMTQVAHRAIGQLPTEHRPSLLDLFRLTEFDDDALAETLARHPSLLTIEEGFRGRGGLDALICNLVSERGLSCRTFSAGLDNRYRFDLGTRDDLHERAGIGEQSLRRRMLDLMGEASPSAERNGESSR